MEIQRDRTQFCDSQYDVLLHCCAGTKENNRKKLSIRKKIPVSGVTVAVKGNSKVCHEYKRRR